MIWDLAGMIVVVMGVSGSGKTAVGRALAARLGWAFEDADDRHPAANVETMRRGVPLSDDERRPWMRSLSDAVRTWESRARDVVLACSALGKWQRDALRAAVTDGGAIRFVHLNGTRQLIDRRLRQRGGHFMPESLLESQFDALETPDTGEALVVDVEPPVAAVVGAIVEGLRLDAIPSRRRSSMPSDPKPG